MKSNRPRNESSPFLRGGARLRLCAGSPIPQSPRVLPRQTRSTELQTQLCCGSLSRRGTRTLVRLSEPDRQRDHQHSDYRKNYPEPILVGVKPFHLPFPVDSTVSLALAGAVGSAYSGECTWSCSLHTRPASASKPKSNARLFRAMHICAPANSASIARSYGRRKLPSSLRLRSVVRSGQQLTSFPASARHQTNQCWSSSTQSSNVSRGGGSRSGSARLGFQKGGLRSHHVSREGSHDLGQGRQRAHQFPRPSYGLSKWTQHQTMKGCSQGKWRARVSNHADH